MSNAHNTLLEKAAGILNGIEPGFASLSEKSRLDIARLFISDLIMAQKIPTMAIRWFLASDDDQQAILNLLSFEADEDLCTFYAEKIRSDSSKGAELPTDIAAILDDCPDFSYATA